MTAYFACNAGCREFESHSLLFYGGIVQWQNTVKSRCYDYYPNIYWRIRIIGNPPVSKTGDLTVLQVQVLYPPPIHSARYSYALHGPHLYGVAPTGEADTQWYRPPEPGKRQPEAGVLINGTVVQLVRTLP